ncbi:hypothetical protein ORI90_09895, partial [Bifidobacterium longum]|nr:hypothetical protein [Bifidobacterium longum]
MIGQEVVTKTLKIAIMTGQTTHAYLFNGPRGTGKTSAAKIFAKAINCLNPINGEPDGVCAMCQAADNGTLGDIIELDAASNNGVDEIREIREDVNYAPTQAILDQALSFGDGHVTLENALLVTGSVTQTLLGEYVHAVVKQDTKQALAKLSEVLSAGKDANRFVEDLISYARDLLLHTEAPELISIVPDET